MAFSLQPPPVDADVAELYQWCFRLWEWLQVPERPCFLVTKSAAQSNIATGSNVTVTFDVEIFDIGGNFASNTFTAPIAGKYLLTAVVRLQAVDTAAAYYQCIINTSNRAYYFGLLDPGGFYDGAAYDPVYWSFGGSVVADMDAGDTATVDAYQSGGTQQTDIDGQGASSMTTYFSGVLVAR